VLRPNLQALLLADHVYQDKDTGKKVIAGTFNRLNLVKRKPPNQVPTDATDNATEPPSEKTSDIPPGMRELKPQDIMSMGSPTAYASLTEIRGLTQLELRYVDLSNNAVLFGAKIDVICDDPLQTVEAVIRLPRLPSPHVGVYALELLWNDELLGSHRVTAVDAANE
jgi:hypothetical protein